MKKSLLTLMLSALMLGAFAQGKMNELFKNNVKLIFMGYDLSQARFIGTDGFTDPAAIKDKFVAAWNNTFVAEYEKFSLQKAFKLTNDKYETNVDVVQDINGKLNIHERVMNGSYSIGEDDVKKAVSHYNSKEKDAVGLVYVVESFNKTLEKAVIWVTFVDLSNNKVLYTEKVEEKAGGFGLKNYWIAPATKLKK
ncbi:MAG TPA: hypothetical protein PKM40_02645, partial [Bacteroidia bacterium]|nr:hypothetical protein [Bacteroidia bacterium]